MPTPELDEWVLHDPSAGAEKQLEKSPHSDWTDFGALFFPLLFMKPRVQRIW